MDILLDFDETCVAYNHYGAQMDIGSEPVIKRLVEEGHRLILWTVRSDMNHNHLSETLNWFVQRDIPLWGINERPGQKEWSDSPKPSGDLIIDNLCLGIPLVNNRDISHKPFVDWYEVEKMLEDREILKRKE